MRRGTPEIMKEAMESLREVVRVIDKGEGEAEVLMPIDHASLAFRIRKETFQRMGERRQELGISVIDKNVIVRLFGRESERREAYWFLYGLTQNIAQGTEAAFLENREIPPSLKKEFPGVEEIIKVLEGSALPNEDLVLLRTHLEALWQGLRDRRDLQPPENALTSVAY